MKHDSLQMKRAGSSNLFVCLSSSVTYIFNLIWTTDDVEYYILLYSFLKNSPTEHIFFIIVIIYLFQEYLFVNYGTLILTVNGFDQYGSSEHNKYWILLVTSFMAFYCFVWFRLIYWIIRRIQIVKWLLVVH